MLTDLARPKAALRPETFLQFVGLKLMGPPTSAGNRWVWPCPACGDGTAFSTMPHKPEHRDRVICFRCRFRGDEADLLKQCLPGQDWPARRALLEQWRAEFDALSPAPGVNGRPSTYPPSGNGDKSRRTRVYDTDPRHDEFSPEADEAAAELIALVGDPLDADTRDKLLLIEKALEVCGRHRLHPLGLAVRAGFEAWTAGTDAEHMAECHDPDCDNYCCRRARGWTVEEIEADIETGRRERQAKRSRRGKRRRTVPACHAPRRPPD